MTADATFDGFTFAELQTPTGLARLDARFLERLGEADAGLRDRLERYRAGAALDPRELSALLLELGPHVEDYAAELFGVEQPLAALRAEIRGHDPVLRFKNEFVLRRCRKLRDTPATPFAELDAWLEARIAGSGDREADVAAWATGLLTDPERNADALERVTAWCALAQRTEEGRRAVAGWSAFVTPDKIDHAALVPLVDRLDDAAGRREGPPERRRRRDGFELTDARWGMRRIQGEVNYCIYCHEHDGDFCSKGFPEKKRQPELGLKVDPLGNRLTGCPLEEKVSEMHVFRRDGWPLAALAVAMVDNPMVPATGHRICNDCMKACIYQKQDPVDIPQIETGVLTDVLRLPFGVELYHLLARWNPLRREQYVEQPYNGRRVLVAGMGPAGFTMAHHLTMAGCAVVGIDGLKVEPLPAELLEGPVRNWDELEEPLDERILLGFGGVAEYGITVRWDKNFLKLDLPDARRGATTSGCYGGVRLGRHACASRTPGIWASTTSPSPPARACRASCTSATAWPAACARPATSSWRCSSPAPARKAASPICRCACPRWSSAAASPVSTPRPRCRRTTSSRWRRRSSATRRWSPRAARRPCAPRPQRRGLGRPSSEFLAHGRAVRDERARAAAVGEAPDFAPLLRAWGGVTIAYRKGLNDSPAYIRNHEEVAKAMEEGIFYAEGLDPLHCELDDYGHVRALLCRRMQSRGGRWLATPEEVRLPARAVFVAAGTVPNTIYEREHKGTFALEGDHFLPHRGPRRRAAAGGRRRSTAKSPGSSGRSPRTASSAAW
ncbi:MAG: hypothetical protein U5K43_01815 [Halofilum sp. (in: g-proteobacteria)]|nr:hypothetical protein [Halofilum sp. (in: g-proteobacteria)]